MMTLEQRKELLDIQDARLLLNTAFRRMENELGALALRGSELGRKAIVLEHEQEIFEAIERLKGAIERARKPLRTATERSTEEVATPTNLQWVDFSVFDHSQRMSGEVFVGVITRLSLPSAAGDARVGTEYFDGLGERENDSFVRPLFLKFADALTSGKLTRYQLAAAVERGVLKDEEADFAILVVNS